VTDPLYEEAAALLEDNILQSKFASINCFDSGQFCLDVSVKAYPSLRHYHVSDGLYDEFLGSKNIAEFVNIIPTLQNRTNVVYIRKLSELTAGRVTLKKPTSPPKPVASPVAPVPPAGVSPEPIYLTDDGLSALVKLNLPDLGPDTPVFLNFTISANRHHLLLNNELFALLVPNPSMPPRLRAQQMVSNSLRFQATGRRISLQEWLAGQVTEQTLALDYDFTMKHRDDPSIEYYNYHPVLQVNIIGARCLQDGSVVDTQPHTLLDGTRGQQKIVEVHMREQNHATSTSPDRSFTISAVKLIDRPKDYRVPRGPRPCSLASWRCADIADPPWYREVWYDHFDEYGRIGCLRREVLLWWRSLRPAVLYLLCPSWCIMVVWKACGSLSRRRALRSRDNSFKKGILS
jgi:hypothetical protein